ncbi:hypothetical protein C0993_007738, partial [Termitomyces sp. T159_Od127]
PPLQTSGTSFIEIISSPTTSTSPTTGQDPTQLSETTNKPSGPIIGGAVGGSIFVALSVLAAVMIIKRRCRRKQNAPTPTANPLLDDPRVRELADQRDLSAKRSANYNLAASGISDNQKQSAPEHSSQELTQSSSRSDLELAMQRQMEMMSIMSQRISALEANQRGHEDTATEPPDYESHAST